MAKKALIIDTVYLRSDFYRDRYRRLVLIFFVTLSIIVLLSSFILYIFLNPPPKIYFRAKSVGPAHSDLKLFDYGLTESANNTDADVLQWITDAVYHTFTLDYINYTTELEESRGQYTDLGWNDFVTTLTSLGMLDQIVKHQYITQASARSAPNILKKGIVNDIYTWKITLPILIYFANGMDIYKREYTLDILVQRAASELYPRGMAIAAFAATADR